jgi:hypothetical protein
MGIHLRTIPYCDCQKALQEQSPMKKIAIKTISENYYEIIYQCDYCNRSIRLQLKMIYMDYKKGVDLE